MENYKGRVGICVFTIEDLFSKESFNKIREIIIKQLETLANVFNRTGYITKVDRDKLELIISGWA